MTAWRSTIVALNSLSVGDIEAILKKLEAVRVEVRAQGQDELADRLDEAAGALGRGQLSDYRRLLSQVVSRLGHLKAP